MKSSTLLLMTLTAVIGDVGANASTIRLERDGSGEFTVLQDALDAAAVGDTILIGPGRYDDFQIKTFLPGGVGAIIGDIRSDSLTIIGESAETVIIGPELMMNDYQGERTFGLRADTPSPVTLSLQGVTVEHTSITVLLEGPSRVVECTFRSESNASTFMDYTVPARVVILRSSFELGAPANTLNTKGLASPINFGPDHLLLEDCDFVSVGFILESIDSLEVRDVRMRDGAPAFVYADGLVANLVVVNSAGNGIFTDSVDLDIRNSRFQGGGGGASSFFSTNSIIRGSRIVFAAPLDPPTEDASIYLGAVKGFTLRDCDIEPGALYSVAAWTDVERTAEFDLTGNFWGTTDSVAIEDLIFDNADKGHPDYPTNWDLSRVRFMPVLNGSVPTERESVGGLKSRFRRVKGSGS